MYEEENDINRLVSVESEQSVLGGLLQEPLAMAKCRDLMAEMFYLPQHRIIYQTLRDMAASQLPIDAVTVSDMLDNKNQKEETGGLSYLIDLVQNIPSAKNISRYVENIKNRYTERELLKASAEIERIALSKDGATVADKCAKASVIVSAVNKTAINESTEKTYAESAADMLNFLSEMNERGGGLIGLPTGITELDNKTSGLQKGNLIVIAARPSMGKTVLAENIARRVAKSGKKVHFQSYEMVQRELLMRGAAAEMGIDFKNLKSSRLTAKEYDDLSTFTANLITWNLSIDTAPLDVDSLCLMAMDKKMQGGLDLLVIDHLHLMPWVGKDAEYQELGKITKRLKRLAMELDIPVLLLAQLNRGVAKQNDKRPTMADIRGSGSIEQDANIIIMPHRESYYNDSVNPNEAELIIAKNRDGEMGTVVCGWEGRYQRFADWVMPWSNPNESKVTDYAY